MPTNEGETKIIMEHVFKKDKNNENLEVALDIISRAQKIRRRIIKPFLKKLQDYICKELDMSQLDMSQWKWETELCDKPFEGNNYHSFGVYIKFEKEPVFISLSGNPAGNNLEIYIAVHTDNQLFHESMNCLRIMLDKVFGPGSSESNGRWFWWSPSLKKSSNYADWYNKDTLIEMHTDHDCVVKDIGDHLFRIIEVAQPVIDQWVKKNSPSQ